MTPEQKLELGIEIVAAMKASCFDWNIETGRIEALMETEIDRMEGVSKEMLEEMSQNEKDQYGDYCRWQKERLHKQALFVAEIALEKIRTMKPAMSARLAAFAKDLPDSEIKRSDSL